MKTLFLTACMLAGACLAFAQTPTPYYSGFDNTAQQTGWQKYRKGTLSPYQWDIGPGGVVPSPPYCASHNFPAGGAPIPIVDWLISPVFNFTGGGKVDSIKINVYAPTGIATTDDHFGMYLLSGSPDPALATVTLLADFTSMVTTLSSYKDTFNFVIPPTGGNCYIGFKYTGLNNWFVPHFDNIKISAGASCNAPASISISPGITSVNINWTAEPGASGYKYVLDNSPSAPTIAGTPTINTSFSTPGLTSSTTYYFHVKTECGSTITSGWKTQAFTTQAPVALCGQPTGIDIHIVTDSSARLDWYAISGAKGFEYVVSEDPTLPVASGNTALINYANISNLKAGTQYYAYIRTRCDGTSGFIFSPWVGKEFNTVFPTSVSSSTVNRLLRVYPNPVSNILTLEGAVGHILISDLSGRILYTTMADGEPAYINMTQYPAGIYILQYTSGSICQHIKLNKQ